MSLMLSGVLFFAGVFLFVFFSKSKLAHLHFHQQMVLQRASDVTRTEKIFHNYVLRQVLSFFPTQPSFFFFFFSHKHKHRRALHS